MKLGWIVYSYKPSADSGRVHAAELEDDDYGEFRLYPSEDVATEALLRLGSRSADNPGLVYGVAEVVA